MKLKIFILIFFFNCAYGQSYEKDWAAISKKFESGENVSIKELEGYFQTQKSLDGHPDNSTQLCSVLANSYYTILAGAGPATKDRTNRNSENDGIVTAYEPAC